MVERETFTGSSVDDRKIFAIFWLLIVGFLRMICSINISCSGNNFRCFPFLESPLMMDSPFRSCRKSFLLFSKPMLKSSQASLGFSLPCVDWKYRVNSWRTSLETVVLFFLTVVGVFGVLATSIPLRGWSEKQISNDKPWRLVYKKIWCFLLFTKIGIPKTRLFFVTILLRGLCFSYFCVLEG